MYTIYRNIVTFTEIMIDIENVISVVTKAVNFIRARRQFKIFLFEV
jgi:hypothetical protein